MKEVIRTRYIRNKNLAPGRQCGVSKRNFSVILSITPSMSFTATPNKMSLPQAAALRCLLEASPYLVPPEDTTWRLGISLVSPTAHHILICCLGFRVGLP